MALTKLDPTVIGQDSSGSSKLISAGGSVSIDSSGNVRIANSTANSILMAADGNVGINTSTMPLRLNGKTLAINGTTSGQNYQAGIELQTNTTTGGEIWYNTSQGMVINSYQELPVTIRTNNLERVTTAANGNVGIGTTTPSTTLVVNGTATIGTLRANTFQSTSGTTYSMMVQCEGIYNTTNLSVSTAVGTETQIPSTIKGLTTRAAGSKLLYSVIIPYEVDNNSGWTYLVLYRRIAGGSWSRQTESVLMNKLDGGDGTQQSSFQYVDAHGAAVGTLVEYSVYFYAGDANLGVEFNQPALVSQKYSALSPTVGFIAELMG